MVNEIMEFLGIVGLTEVPPATLGELIPYLIQLCIGCVLICCAIRLVGYFIRGLFDWRR